MEAMEVSLNMHDRTFKFTYEGGPYIDVYYPGPRAQSRLWGEPLPSDVINVWDYETGKATVTSYRGFVIVCADWLNETYYGDKAAMMSDIYNYNYSY